MKSIPVNSIPEELWADQALQLPIKLRESYWQLVEDYGIAQDVQLLDDGGTVIGGSSKELTLKHFARRYGVSYCRLESLIIDPESAFATIPDDLIIRLIEGRISILDIACGTGAVGAAVLCAISVLRANDILPKLPLGITIIGGDCSDYALKIYQEMIDQLRPLASSVGIEVTLQTTKWQAESSYTTSDMFDLLFTGDSKTEEYLVIIANFAGTLSQHFAKFQDSIHHIFDRTSNKKCSIIWVESRIKGAENVLERIGKWLVNILPWSQASKEVPYAHDYEWYHPFQERKLPCRVLVKKYESSHCELR